MKKVKRNFIKFLLNSEKAFEMSMYPVCIFGGLFFTFVSGLAVYRDLFVQGKSFEDPEFVIIFLLFMSCIFATLYCFWSFKKEFLPWLKKRKIEYYFGLLMATYDESAKIYEFQKMLHKEIGKLYDLTNQSTYLELYRLYANSWRNQDALIKHFYEKEDYESLAKYKNADAWLIEFEKNNNAENLKSSVDEVEKEKKRLENILKDSDVELKEIKDRRIFFETALKKLGIDLK
ncbi:MAG: hypothetical protein U0469_00350 [Candidatus Paceibacterota bacterium]|jgi:hypothetical protein